MSNRSQRRRKQRQKQRLSARIPAAAPAPRPPSSSRPVAASVPRSTRSSVAGTTSPAPAAAIKDLAVHAIRQSKPFDLIAESAAHPVLVVCCRATDQAAARELAQCIRGLVKQYCTLPLDAAQVKGDAQPAMYREPEPIQRRTEARRSSGLPSDVRNTGDIRQGRTRPPVAPPPPGALETHSETGYGDRDDDDLEDLLESQGSLRRPGR